MVELPKAIAEIAAVVGVDAALRIVEEWGGRQFYVPMSPTKALLGVIGPEAAEALCAAMPRAQWRCLPACHDIIRAARDIEIIHAYEHGTSAALISQRYGLTERHVWTVLGRPAPEIDPSLGAALNRRAARLARTPKRRAPKKTSPAQLGFEW